MFAAISAAMPAAMAVVPLPFVAVPEVPSGGAPPELLPVALALHLIGFALGAGAALSLDGIFVLALLDPQGRARWTGQLPRLSRLVWGGFALVVASGALLVVLEPAALTSAKFRAKMLVVLVLGVNAALFHRRVAPRVGEVFFRLGATSLRSASLPRLRRLGFAMGGVSGASWVASAALGFAPAAQPFGFGALVLGYALLLALAAAFGLALDALYRRRLHGFSQRATQRVADDLLGRLETRRTLFGHRITRDRRPPRPPRGE